MATSADYGSWRRRVRLVVLLDAAESAGLVPIPILRLHTLAYFSNVLAPVWKMPALDGRVLKRRGGPFYPGLQHDLDCLVGCGVVRISGLGHIRDEEGRWRLEGAYRLNRTFGDRIMGALLGGDSERYVVAFVRELAFAVSALSGEDFDHAMTEDATYADPLIARDNVVDFGEWQVRNFAANAARSFAGLLPSQGRATPGEMLHLYVRHLHKRVHGGR